MMTPLPQCPSTLPIQRSSSIPLYTRLPHWLSPSPSSLSPPPPHTLRAPTDRLLLHVPLPAPLPPLPHQHIHLEARRQAAQQLDPYAQPDEGGHAAVLHGGRELHPGEGGRRGHGGGLGGVVKRWTAAWVGCTGWVQTQAACALRMSSKQLVGCAGVAQVCWGAAVLHSGTHLTTPVVSSTSMSRSSTTFSCSKE